MTPAYKKARPSEAKGKPLARVGRKATDLDEEAELPDRRQMRSWRVIAMIHRRI
jgi:hypothetical protein